jgi:hypothetical protein
MTNLQAVFTRLTGGLLLGSIAFAGCAAPGADEPKLDEPSIETEVIYAESDDSATRPTRLGMIASGGNVTGSFGRTARFLSWTFTGAEGDTAVIDAADAIRFIRADPSYRELDTVVSLYRATALGNPTGRALAVNDDFGGRLASHIEFALPRAGSYVIVVRRYDYGTTGSVGVTLELRRPTLGMTCGTRGASTICGEAEYCARAPEANCGRADAPGVCTLRPQACIQLYNPVCGCDGTTYGSACDAASAGVSVDYTGECTPPDCRINGCDAGQYCSPCRGAGGGPVYVCIPDGAAC